MFKPNKENINTYLYTGSILVGIAIFDVFLNSFFSINFFNFLPDLINFLLPLILGFIGLYLIRIEFSGIKTLDMLNKNINTNNFNAVLTLLIIFVIIKASPPSLSWFIFDANISGDTKEACTGSGACWTYIKVWFRRFMYGMYPNELHWRINIAFIILIGLAFVGYFAGTKLKKYLTLYYVVIYPIIAFLLIYYLISGGAFGLEWVETGVDFGKEYDAQYAFKQEGSWNWTARSPSVSFGVRLVPDWNHAWYVEWEVPDRRPKFRDADIPREHWGDPGPRGFFGLDQNCDWHWVGHSHTWPYHEALSPASLRLEVGEDGEAQPHTAALPADRHDRQLDDIVEFCFRLVRHGYDAGSN